MLAAMKQLFLFFVGPAVLFLLIAGCKPAAVIASGTTPVGQIDSDNEALVKATSQEILQLFAERSFEQLAKHIHPEKGVRFSAYSYIDPATDRVFSQEEFVRQSKNRDSLDWGWYDGSGDTIRLPFHEYINRFVYTADFLHAEKTVVNETIGFGNTINNQQEIYPGNPYTESWFSGFDPKFEGMDWCSLRLIYEIVGEKAYLIGVIHDQWTI
jgi:hypothetical protein